MATEVTITSKYVTDNTINSDNTAVSSVGGGSGISAETPDSILEKLLIVDLLYYLSSLHQSQPEQPCRDHAAPDRKGRGHRLTRRRTRRHSRPLRKGRNPPRRLRLLRRLGHVHLQPRFTPRRCRLAALDRRPAMGRGLVCLAADRRGGWYLEAPVCRHPAGRQPHRQDRLAQRHQRAVGHLSRGQWQAADLFVFR